MEYKGTNMPKECNKIETVKLLFGSESFDYTTRSKEQEEILRSIGKRSLVL